MKKHSTKSFIIYIACLVAISICITFRGTYILKAVLAVLGVIAGILMSIWWIIAAIPLGVWLLLLILK